MSGVAELAGDLGGFVEPGFEPVRDAFAASFADDMGAALAVRHEGRLVVDLWGGTADPRTGAPWQAGTTSVIFSCTKGLMSLLAAMLVRDGKLDYDAPAARYWPEFAAAGKAGATVGDLLAHRAGLPAPTRDLSTPDILRFEEVAGMLAAQAPLWTPGAAHAYHPITHGWLSGELVHRVTGEMSGRVFADRIAEPLGGDAWIGLPEDQRDRVAYMWAAPSLSEAPPAGEDAAARELLQRAMTLGGALPVTLVGEGTGFNDPVVQEAEIPGAGGIATARALATIWSAAVVETEGVRLVDDGAIAAGVAVRSEGEPFIVVPGPWPRWGAGLQLDSEARRYLTPTAFGHDGAGGQVAFADPVTRTGFAYLTNRMESGDDRRATSVIDALRRVLL